MEEVTEKIVELLEEREKLLKERESNRFQIWICEQEIYMYTHLYETLSQLMKIKTDNIESYVEFIDYRKDNAPFGWPGLVSGYKHIVPMIDDLQEENNDMHEYSNKIKGYISSYSETKKSLEEKNSEIEERLTIIEGELGIEHEAPKVLKKEDL